MLQPLEVLEPLNKELELAFVQLQASLHQYFRSRLTDVVQAEDLLQDVFLKAVRTVRSGHKIDNLRAWLYAVAKTSLVDYYRRANGEPVERLDKDCPSSEDDSLQLHQNIASCLEQLIDRLAPIYRDTLIATDLRNVTMGLLAEEQQLSISAIKSRVVRARAMLRDKLLECCHVEMSHGLVSDYDITSKEGCC